MWPGQRGDTKGQPLHPNLRLRWFENMSMVINITTRVLFVLLLAGVAHRSTRSCSAPWWLDPAGRRRCWLNFRVARSMEFANRRDYLFAAADRPGRALHGHPDGPLRPRLAEVLQPPADRQLGRPGEGRARQGHRLDLPVRRVRCSSSWCRAAIWLQLPIGLRSDILAVGWPILGVITVLQTAWMCIKAMQRYRGFKA